MSQRKKTGSPAFFFNIRLRHSEFTCLFTADNDGQSWQLFPYFRDACPLCGKTFLPVYSTNRSLTIGKALVFWNTQYIILLKSLIATYLFLHRCRKFRFPSASLQFFTTFTSFSQNRQLQHFIVVPKCDTNGVRNLLEQKKSPSILSQVPFDRRCIIGGVQSHGCSNWLFVSIELPYPQEETNGFAHVNA